MLGTSKIHCFIKVRPSFWLKFAQILLHFQTKPMYSNPHFQNQTNIENYRNVFPGFPLSIFWGLLQAGFVSMTGIIPSTWFVGSMAFDGFTIEYVHYMQSSYMYSLCMYVYVYTYIHHMYIYIYIHIYIYVYI